MLPLVIVSLERANLMRMDARLVCQAASHKTFADSQRTVTVSDGPVALVWSASARLTTR
jgi:hypothetical protein